MLYHPIHIILEMFSRCLKNIARILGTGKNQIFCFYERYHSIESQNNLD